MTLTYKSILFHLQAVHETNVKRITNRNVNFCITSVCIDVYALTSYLMLHVYSRNGRHHKYQMYWQIINSLLNNIILV